MKIKSLIAAMSAIAIASQLAFAAGGPVPPTPVTPPVNPINVARAFALKTPDYYEGQLTGNFLVGSDFTFKVMSFRMEKNFSITSLLVGETVIPLPEPIYGLPMGVGGIIRNASLYINGMTDSGEYAGSGRLDKLVVNKGESLFVELIPAEIAVEIPVDPKLQGNVQVNIDNFPYGYGYGTIMANSMYIFRPSVAGIIMSSMTVVAGQLFSMDGWNRSKLLKRQATPMSASSMSEA